MSHDSRALSFGSTAGNYNAVRPTYPATAIGWALGTDPLRVADLGAGTGILTRALAACGHTVVSVDPDPQMLAQLRDADPAATVLRGAAERIPLAGDAVDAAVAGQAYHWFDTAHAHAEIVRVLRPGGRFAVLWNLPDERVPWVAEFSRIVGHKGTELLSRWTFAELAPHFTAPERGVFDHESLLRPEALVTLARSHSAYLVADPAERAAKDRDLNALAYEHPDLVGRSSFPLPYRTVVYRMRAATG